MVLSSELVGGLYVEGDRQSVTTDRDRERASEVGLLEPRRRHRAPLSHCLGRIGRSARSAQRSVASSGAGPWSVLGVDRRALPALVPAATRRAAFVAALQAAGVIEVSLRAARVLG